MYVCNMSFFLISDPVTEVRQSGFSLSGEICKHSFQLISVEDAKKILELLLNNLDTGMYVCMCECLCIYVCGYVCMYV